MLHQKGRERETKRALFGVMHLTLCMHTHPNFKLFNSPLSCSEANGDCAFSSMSSDSLRRGVVVLLDEERKDSLVT